MKAQGRTTKVEGHGVTSFAEPPAMTMTGTANGLPLRARMVHGTEYVWLPPQARMQTAGHKPWPAVDLGQLDQGQSGSSASPVTGVDPTRTLAYLQAVSTKVTKVDSATVRGTQTTEYKATVDLDKVAARQQSKAAKQHVRALEQMTGKKLPVTVWLDGQGRLRQEKVSTPVRIQDRRATSDLLLDLYDFGTPVHVKAPPAAGPLCTPTSRAAAGRRAIREPVLADVLAARADG